MGEQVRPWVAPPPQPGRRFVVTGANSGVGLATVRALAEQGAHVVMACRSTAKGEAAAATVVPRSGGQVEVRALDLADLASVRAFAADVGDVDVLVNNAGVLAVPFGLSVDGVETHLATNHLGHFALSLLLLPRLTDRVVVIGSVSHRAGELDLDDLDWRRRGYRPYAAYAASKLANLSFLGELQRRLTDAGSTLRAVGAHPGTTATGITGHTGRGLATTVGSFGHRLVGMPPWRGALPGLYAATMDVPGNTYLGPHGPGEMFGWPVPVGRAQAALDPDLAGRLWTTSERLGGVAWPG